MTDQEFVKKCLICGDKAIGNNFDALSCESCKAFFRRNATKPKELNCNFQNKCQIDVLTRRFCKKCRLKKCFDIGMKKDWILSPEEKKERKLKIEMNRKRKISNCTKSSDSSDTNSLENTNNDNSCENINCENSSEIINCNKTDNPLQEIVDSLNLELDFDIEDINTEIEKIENYIENNNSKIIQNSNIICEPTIRSFENSENISEIIEFVMNSDQINGQNSNYIEINANEISNKLYEKGVEPELSVISISRPLTDYANSFNELEGNKLTEVLNATNILMSSKPTTVQFYKLDYDLYGIKLEQVILKIIQMCKNLSAFKSICAEDQHSLVKYGSMEMFCMRAIETFEPQRSYWTLVLDNNMSFKMRLDDISVPCYVSTLYKNFLQGLSLEWDSDPIILNLLTVIVLFDPNRPNLKHKQVVKLQQQIYLHLLKRYLLLKYQSEIEMNSKVSQLLKTLIDLNALGEIKMKNCIELVPQHLPPLVQEIYGIKTDSMEAKSNLIFY